MSGVIVTERATKNPRDEADVNTTVRLLRGVERLPEGASGAFLFGDKKEPGGTILVENSRICWASAEGMETRLTDILLTAANTPLSRDVIEEVYDRCRRDGTPLGAALVARGVVTPRGLRTALLTHTGEAIAVLSQALGREGRVAPAWIPNRARRYDAQFTFLPTEIVAAAGSRGREAEAARARSALERALEDEGAGAAFLDDAEAELPVCELRGEELGVEGLVELGRWARHAQLQSGAFTSAAFVAATMPTREGAVSWREDGTVCVAFCQDRSSFANLIARRARG